MIESGGIVFNNVNIVGRAQRLLMTPSEARFRRAARTPRLAQRKIWESTRKLLRSSSYWGSSLPSRLCDVPLSEYETYHEALQGSIGTGYNALNGETVEFWSGSTGTTGARKLFPLTASYRRQFQQLNGPMVYGLLRRFPRFSTKKVLYLVTASSGQYTEANVSIGYISYFNYNRISPLLRRFYVFPPEVLRDAETFRKWAHLYVLANDISGMLAITPAVLTTFLRAAWDRREELWPYLIGQRQPGNGLPSLRLRKSRISQLEQAFASSFRLENVWPSLQAIGCWTAAACGLQVPELQALGPSIPIVDVIYSATEGWINVPRYSDRAGGPIHAGAHVYEFFPAGESPPHKGSLLGPDELIPGQHYEIVLTTAMGLVRYRLKDIVVCTGRFHGVAEVVFVEKSDQKISLGAATLSEPELCEVARRVGLPSTGWYFAPASTGDGLVLVSERSQVQEMIAAIDRVLMDENHLYSDFVKSGVLHPLSLGVAEESEIRPAPHAQTKPRILSWHPTPRVKALNR